MSSSARSPDQLVFPWVRYCEKLSAVTFAVGRSERMEKVLGRAVVRPSTGTPSSHVAPSRTETLLAGCQRLDVPPQKS